MEIIRGVENFPGFSRPPIVAVGVFDGVHVGHQAIAREVLSQADLAKVPSAALSFDPHPQWFLSPAQPVLPLLSPLEEKAQLLSDLGLSSLLILQFDRELASTQPEAFAEEVLCKRLGASRVVVGYSHRFGEGRRGDATLLRSLGAELGFEVSIVDPVLVRGAPVNSTRIREALRAGDVGLAEEMLGRPYSVFGEVFSGDRRGTGLEYPTANLELTATGKLIPKDGVYAVLVNLRGEEYEGMMNIGVRPTFGQGPFSLEVHIFDFERELYGESLKVSFVQRLRDEMRFPTKDALRAQIKADEKLARRILVRNAS